MNAKRHHATHAQMRGLLGSRGDFIPTLDEIRALDCGDLVRDPSGHPLAIIRAQRAEPVRVPWTFREEWN